VVSIALSTMHSTSVLIIITVIPGGWQRKAGIKILYLTGNSAIGSFLDEWLPNVHEYNFVAYLALVLK